MTPLQIPFGATSTAAEVIAGVDLSRKCAIVTGASSGIGVETARALAHAGAEVTLAVRDVEAGATVARDIGTDRVAVVALEPHKPGVRRGVASYALDPEHAARLWQMSLETDRPNESVRR